MAIRDLQIRLTTVGKIRLGISPEANNSKNPGKLDVFRFTSPAEHLIQAIAERYGGQCRLWQPQGGGARQFECISQVGDIPVMVPKQTIDPWYEAWGNGVMQRKCDGDYDQVKREACACDPNDRICKPTTRINVGLSDIPGLGVWMIESHGWNAAAELSGLTGLLQMLPDGIRLPGRLILEARRSKKIGDDPRNPGERKVITRDFRVPIILFDSITMAAINAGGGAIIQALGQTSQAPALQASTPEQSREIARDRLYAQIDAAESLDQLAQIGQEARQIGITPDNDGVFIARWRAVKAELIWIRDHPGEQPDQPTKQSGGPCLDPYCASGSQPCGYTPNQHLEAHGAATIAPHPGMVVEAKVVEAKVVGFDPDEEFNLILAGAADLGWNTADVQERILAYCGKAATEASGDELHAFQVDMKAGKIK